MHVQRAWPTMHIIEWADDPEAEAVLLLQGSAGSGTTALLRWFAERGRIGQRRVLASLLRDHDGGRVDPLDADTLGNQLQAAPRDPRREADTVREAHRWGLDERSGVILIDALDECTDKLLADCLDLLAHVPPADVRFVIASHSVPSRLQQLGVARHVLIGDPSRPIPRPAHQPPDPDAEFRSFVGGLLAEAELPSAEVSGLATRIAERSGRSALVAAALIERLLTDEAAGSSVRTVEPFATLPPRLAAAYRHRLSTLAVPDRLRRSVADLLGILAAVPAAGTTLTSAAAAIDGGASTLRTTLDVIAPLLRPGDSDASIRVFHESFGLALTDPAQVSAPESPALRAWRDAVVAAAVRPAPCRWSVEHAIAVVSTEPDASHRRTLATALRRSWAFLATLAGEHGLDLAAERHRTLAETTAAPDDRLRADTLRTAATLSSRDRDLAAICADAAVLTGDAELEAITLAALPARTTRCRAWSPLPGDERVVRSGDSDIEFLSWSPDGRYLASQPRFGAVELWDRELGRSLRIPLEERLGHDAFAWLDDGVHFAVARRGRAWKILDVAGRLVVGAPGALLAEALGEPPPDPLLLRLNRVPPPPDAPPDAPPTPVDPRIVSPDGRLFVNRTDGIVSITDADGRLVHALDHGPVGLVRWHPGSTLLATGGSDGAVRVWSIDRSSPNGRGPRPTRAGRAEIKYLGWSADGETLVGATAEDLQSPARAGQLTFWDPDGAERTTITAHEGWIEDVAWHPVDPVVASAGRDGFITFSGPGGVILRRSKAHADWAHRVTWSPDGQSLLSTGFDGRIKVWREPGRSDRATTTADLGRDNAPLAVWNHDGTGIAHRWFGDVVVREPSGRELAKIERLDVTRSDLISSRVGALAVSCDGILAATGHSGGGALFRLDGERLAQLATDTWSCHGLTWSPDGTRLVAWDSSMIRVYDVTGALLAERQDTKGFQYRAAWSPDSQTLATVSSRHTRLWDRDGGIIDTIADRRTRASATAWSSRGTLAVGWANGGLSLHLTG